MLLHTNFLVLKNLALQYILPLFIDACEVSISYSLFVTHYFYCCTYVFLGADCILSILE